MLESDSEARAQSRKPDKLANVQPFGRPIFNIQYQILGIFGLRHTEAGIGFRSKTPKPAKLANAQPVGRPIFNIQYPILGIEYLAFNTQRLESASEARDQSWPSSQLCSKSNVHYSIFNIRSWELNIWPSTHRGWNQLQKQELKAGQARNCAASRTSNIQYSVSDIGNELFGLRRTEAGIGLRSKSPNASQTRKCAASRTSNIQY